MCAPQKPDSRKTTRARAMRLVAALFGFLAVETAHSAAPPANTPIGERAEVTYFNNGLGIFESLRTNDVEARVAATARLGISEAEEQKLPAATSGSYVFQASNNGNVDLDIRFDIAQPRVGAFELVGSLYLDLNDNGVVDASDIAVGPDMPIRFQAGSRASLIYQFNTPPDVDPDDASILQLTARASAVHQQDNPEAPLTLTRQVRTMIVEGSLNLSKSALLRDDDRQIDYTIAARNTGANAIRPYDSIDEVAVEVDGVQRSAIVIRDQIPLNTTFHAFRDSAGFLPVYHIRGQPKHSYTTVAPQQLSEVDAVAFLFERDFGSGFQTAAGFTVSVFPTLSDRSISNVAESYTDAGDATRTIVSNAATSVVSAGNSTIEFLSTIGGPPLTVSNFGQDLVVSINAANCNITTGIDEIEIPISTTGTQDRETVIARETGPNTGVFFSAPLGLIESVRATAGNGVLEGRPGSTARASIMSGCITQELSVQLALQPGGFLFDSVTNQPVANARIAVTDVNDVRVAETTSDSLGYYSLGSLAPGNYRLEVVPPAQYEYPSTRRFFPGFGRLVDAQVSYGIQFEFNGGDVNELDVPLDHFTDISATLDKTADRKTMRRGEFIIYTLTAQNRMDQGLVGAVIEDRLPAGFIIEEDSARLDDDPSPIETSVSPDGLVTFHIERIAAASEVKLTYIAKAGPSSGQGEKTNIARLKGFQAGTARPVESDPAFATVTLDDRGGVFSDQAVVMGRVFLDRNGDGIQTATDDEGNQHDEPGVPGVKIVTSTGLSVVTDALGRYSLFGLRPLTHTFALQSATLPRGTSALGTDIDDILSAGSRLVDAKRGEVRGEDFALRWTEEAAADVAERRSKFEGLDTRDSLLRSDLPLAAGGAGRVSSRSQAGLDTKTELVTGDPDKKQEKPEEAESAKPKTIDIETRIATLDSTLGFVDIEDGAEVARSALTLRVKGPMEGNLRLELNGEDIPRSKIGATAIDSESGVQLLEYIALPLKPKENTIAVIVTDPFGNDRGREEIRVFAPGEPAALVIVAPNTAPADAKARIPIVVRIVDEDGRLVRSPAEVTLTAKKGQWDVRDIRDTVFGLQTYIDDGEATFDFIPPDLVGGALIGVEADFAKAETEIGFVPDLSERIFVGVVEGAVALGDDGDTIEGYVEKDNLSAFEETTDGVRGQIYLKGKILGENLLTLRYDGDRDTNERLFRDIASDEFYPVYGDNSERGFDAQSNSPLYVKVERGQSYILYGDVAIDARADAIRLGAYRRSLTGGHAHYEDDTVTVDVFVAETNEAQRVIEIPGRGVSGPYDVDLPGLVDGSEIVEIITRDRDQPAIILSARQQTRLSDYTIDFFRGSLLFNRPVPLIDDDLNPVSIRITYETDEGAGETYYIFGAEVRVEPVEGIAVGYREVRSEASRAVEERRIVRSGYAEADLGDLGKVQVEVAQTEDQHGDTGIGARASYEVKTDGHAIRAEVARTEEAFDAPNSSVSPGREEVRVTTAHRLSETAEITTDTIYSSSLESGERKVGTELKTRYNVSPSLAIIGGARATDTTGNGKDERVLSGIVGVNYTPAFLSGVTLRAEYEQDFLDAHNWRMVLGGDYQWSPELRFHAVSEISSTESGFFGLGGGSGASITTKVGAEYQFTPEISTFTEFRQSGDSDDGGVASGVKGEWKLDDRVSLRMGAEHLEPMTDGGDRKSAANFGVTYEDDEKGLIASNDIELDRDDAGYGVYTDTALGYELNQDFTLLFRNRLALDLRDETRIRDRMRIGFGWRPADDSRVKALALYEYELDDASALTESAHRWSAAVVYSATSDLRLNGKIAGESFTIDTDAQSLSSTLHLARAGVEVDVLKDEQGRDRVAIGGHVAVFTDNSGENLSAAVGVELKANIIENVQVGVGYNHIGVKQKRLRNLYQSGFYARLKLKLDGSVWDEFDDLGLTDGFGLLN